MKRAVTDKEKKAILEQIYQIWKQNPELRLMQLIDDALHEVYVIGYIEDDEFADIIEEHYGKEH